MDSDIESNIQLILKPDSVNPYEQCISTLTPLITTKSVESTGGRNQMSFEEIRSFVINKSSENKTITPSDLERKAADYNCSIEKIRHDILLLYRLNSTLKDTNGDLLSSGSGVFKFNLDDVPFRSEIKARILKPSFIYKYNDTKEQFEYQKNPSELKDYLVSYRNNKNSEVCFPYFIKTLFSDTIKSNVYNMAYDNTYFTEIEYYDAYALDTVSINNVTVLRNPILEMPTEDEISKGLEGFYSISCNAILGKNLYELLKSISTSSIALIAICIIDLSSNNKYCFNCSIPLSNTLREPIITNNIAC